VLKVTIVFTNTRIMQSIEHASLSNRSELDDSVVEAMPLFDKTVLNVVDAVDHSTVVLSLQHVPDFAFDHMKVWIVGWI